MNLTHTTFRALSNSHNGTSDTETEMTFTSDDGVVIGRYSGGGVVVGHVIGKRIGEAEIDLLYQSVNAQGGIQAGQAHGRFAPDAEGRMHMHLDWQWLTGDRSKGQSEWVQIT